MRAQLVLITRILVGVRGDQQRETLHLGRQWHRTAHGGAGAARSFDDLAGRVVDQTMVEGLEADAYILISHKLLQNL